MRQVHVEFDLKKVRSSCLADLIKKNGVPLCCLNIMFSLDDACKYDISGFMKNIVEILNPLYGRVFVPRDIVKRTNGCYDVLGGLPGLHPINFFGGEIVKKLNVDAIKTLPNVCAQEMAGGLFVEFVERFQEFSCVELARLEPIFGEGIFRAFIKKNSQPGQGHFIPWLVETYMETRRMQRDKKIFECDLDSILID